jgi:uncharacterized membrane protein YkoI
VAFETSIAGSRTFAHGRIDLIYRSESRREHSEDERRSLEGYAACVSSEDMAERPDVPITGTDVDQASAVALDYLGVGRVTATEVGDEESYYEVEVTLDDGRQVDVQLDESFIVVGTD